VDGDADAVQAIAKNQVQSIRPGSHAIITTSLADRDYNTNSYFILRKPKSD
jgi:hypothetical protein